MIRVYAIKVNLFERGSEKAEGRLLRYECGFGSFGSFGSLSAVHSLFTKKIAFITCYRSVAFV